MVLKELNFDSSTIGHLMKVFFTLVENAWHFDMERGTPMFVLTHKLQHVKQVLKRWASQLQKGKQARLISYSKKLESVQKALQSSPLTNTYIRWKRNVKTIFLNIGMMKNLH